MLGKFYIALILFALLYAMPARVFAQSQAADVPHTISYQGLLVDNTGQPVQNGTHTLTLRLYVDSEGVVGIWESTIQVTTKNGIFNAILGAPFTDPLPPSVQLNQPLWLGVRLDNNAEMRPLTTVTGTMYALNVADSSISTEKLQDSAVTIAKFQPEFVSSVSADGKKLTTKGSIFDFEAGRGIGFTGDSITHRLTINSQTVLDPSLAGNGLSFDSAKVQLNVNADSVTIGIINDTLRVLAMGIANFINRDSAIWNAIAGAIDSSLTIQQSLAFLVSGDTVIWRALAQAIDSSRAIHNAFTYVIVHDTSVQNAITNLAVNDVRSDTTMWGAIAQAIDTSKDIHVAILNLINFDTAIRNAITNLVVNDTKTDTALWNAIAVAIDSSRNIHIAVANLISRDTNVQNSIIGVVNNAVNNNTTLQNSLNNFINKTDRGRAGAGLSFDTTADAFNVNVDNKLLTITNDTLTVSHQGLATVIQTDSTLWNAIAASVDSSKRIQLTFANLISGDTVVWNSIAVAIDSSKNIDQAIVNLVTKDSSVYNAISNFFNKDTAVQNILTNIVNNAIKSDTSLQNTINQVVNSVDKYHAGNGLSYDTTKNTFNVNVDGRTIQIVNDSLALKDTGLANILKTDTLIWKAVANAIDTSTVIQNAIVNLFGSDSALINLINYYLSLDTTRAGKGLTYNSATKKYDVNVDGKTIAIVNDSLQVIPSGIVNIIKTDTSAWNAIAVSIDSSKNVQQAILNVVLGDSALTALVTNVMNVLDTSRAGNGLSYDTTKKKFNVNVDNKTISIVNDTLQVKPSGIANMIQTDTTVWNGVAIAIDSSKNIQQAILNVVGSQDTAIAGKGLSFNTSTKKLDVNVDNKTIDINNDTLRVKPFGIGNAQLDSFAVTHDKIADSTILGRNIQIPLDLERTTPGPVLIANNSANNTGGVPVVHFSGSSTDGTPTFRVTGNVTGGALGEFNSTASSSEALVGIIDPPGAATSTIEGVRGEVNPGATSTAAPLYGVHGIIDANVQGDSSAGVYGSATATTGNVYGVVGASMSSSFAAAGVRAEGAGAAGPGNPNAAALEINNGAIRVSGAVQPVGSQTATISVGMRTAQITISNSLAQANSLIQITASGNGGSATLGTDHDTFSAIVRTKNPGSFVVEVSCDQGNVPSSESVTLNYFIINQ